MKKVKRQGVYLIIMTMLLTPLLKGGEGLSIPTIVVKTSTNKLSTGNVEIWASGRNYKWSQFSRKVFLDNSKYKVIIQEHFDSKDPVDNLAAILVVSRFDWKRIPGLVPRYSAPESELKVKRGYCKKIQHMLTTKASWEVRVGALLYFFGFPELVDKDFLLRYFDPVGNWDVYDKHVQNGISGGSIGEFIVNHKSPEYRAVNLGLLSLNVYANAYPGSAFDYAMEKLRGKEFWSYPFVNTRAMFVIDAARLSRIPDKEKRRFGLCAASAMKDLSMSYRFFLRRKFSWTDIEYPKEFIEAVLRDPVSGPAFRAELYEQEFWFQIKGITIDWRKETDQRISEALKKLYMKKKKEHIKDKE